MGGGGGGTNNITFPSNPTSGQTYSYQGKSYYYTGLYWAISSDVESRIASSPTAGQILTSNGTGINATFQDIPAGAGLPSQTGNSGKFLKTDGTSLSWDTAGGGSETLTLIASGTFSTGYAEHTFSSLSGYKKIIFNVTGVQADPATGAFWVNGDSSNGSYDNANLAIINDNEYGFSAFAVMPWLTDIVAFGYYEETKANGPSIYFIELDNCLAGGYTNINIDAIFASNSAGGYGSGSIRVTGNSVYQQTTAISSITLAQNFAAGSTYSIYGVS